MAITSRKSSLAALVAVLLAPALAHAADGSKTDAAAPIALASPRDFAAAVQAVEAAIGVKGEKLRVGSVPLEEGRSFAVEPRIAQRLLTGSHATFRKAGVYLFRYERSFGLAADKDQIALLKTADRSVVLRRVGTAGASGEKVVAWLDGLAKEEPFELSEIGVDYVAGRFERAPKDPMAVAKRCAELAPELIVGASSRIDLLANEIAANRTLYLIW
jgi:hypothetical protein